MPAAISSENTFKRNRRRGKHRADPKAKLDLAITAIAITLLFVSISAGLGRWQQMRSLLRRGFRLQVLGPAKITEGIPAEFAIKTTNLAGKAVPAELTIKLILPDGQRIVHKERMSENGIYWLRFPPEQLQPGRLSFLVSARHKNLEEQANISVDVSPEPWCAAIWLPFRQLTPIDKLPFVVFTIAAGNLLPADGQEIQLELLEKTRFNAPLLRWTEKLRCGMAIGSLQLDGVPPGQYLLRARHSKRQVYCRPVQFEVLPRLAPKLFVASDKQQYEPGEKATFTICAWRRGPIADLPLVIELKDASEAVSRLQAVTNASGIAKVVFALPEKPSGQLELEVSTAASASEAEPNAQPGTKMAIPVRTHRLRVACFPEGGRLVPSVENRVYVRITDEYGLPVETEAEVVDEEGNLAAVCRTVRSGISFFDFVPQAGVQYRINVEEPWEIIEGETIPAANSDNKVAIAAGFAVFDPGQPIRFSLRSAEAALPLVAVVDRWGVPLAQHDFVTGQAGKAITCEVPLPERHQGPMELAIFDYGQSPPQLLALRPLFRRPHNALVATVAVVANEKTRLQISVKPHGQAPFSETAFATVIARAIADVEKWPGEPQPVDPAWRLFFPAAEFSSADQLPDWNSVVSGNKEDLVALDLWLGTHSVEWSPSESKSELPEETTEPDSGGSLSVTNGQFPQVSPALVADNLSRLVAQHKNLLHSFSTQSTSSGKIIARLAATGSIALVMFLIMAWLLTGAGSAWSWSATGLAVMFCVLVDTVVFHGQGIPTLRSGPAFCEYPARQAQNDQDETLATSGNRSDIQDAPSNNSAETTTTSASTTPSAEQAPETSSNSHASSQTHNPGFEPHSLPSGLPITTPTAVVWQGKLERRPKDNQHVAQIDLPDLPWPHRWIVQAVIMSDDGRLGTLSTVVDTNGSVQTRVK